MRALQFIFPRLLDMAVGLVIGCAALIGPVMAGPVMADDLNIPYQKFVLDNGLTLIVHEDHKAPIVAVNIWYHVGSKNEVPGRTGFAHLFEHLMFQGSENYDDEYMLLLQQLGATSLNATTWFDRTNYFQNVPINALDTVLWLESDRMGHFAGAITQDKLDKQRGVVQNEKRQGDNQPYGKVWEIMLRQLFPPNHPYSWETIGSMDDLEAATLEDVKEWFATYYGPNNAVLSIAGDVDTAEVRAKVEQYFGDIPPGPPLTKPKDWTPVHQSERRQVTEDRVPQARIYKAWIGPRWGTREAQHLKIAASILAGGKNSRLFKRLVYTDQIATDVSLSSQALEISGITYLVASAQPGVELGTIEAAIGEEIERFIEKGPTRKELKRVKIRQRAGFIRGIERVGGSRGKAGVLARHQVYAGSPDHYKQSLAEIENATRKEVRRAAGKWLGPNAFIMEVHPYPELSASSTGADRSTYPPTGEFPDIDFPDFSRTRLANGLEVLFAKRENLPVVQMSLIVDAGYASDQFAGAGTASLAMAMLDEGTQHASALEIADALAMQGANLSAGSNLDISFVRLSALRSRLDESLEIFADVALNPTFPDHELERLRRNALVRIRQEQTTPISIALRTLPRLLYGEDHPYGQPLTGSGTVASITAIRREDLVAFHSTWFKPNHATLIVVGDLDEVELRTRLEALFGNWQPGDVPEKNLAVTAQERPNVLYLMDRPDADQSVIFAGQLVPPQSNPDEIAIQAVNDILGGLSSARVNMNLREDKGWSYGAYSVIVGARGQRPLLVYGSVQTDKTKESIEEIAKEIRGISGARPPTTDELQIVKRSQTLSLPGRWEASADVLGSLGEIVRYGLADDYWSLYAGRVNALDIAEVDEVARRIITPDEYVWVVIGDRRKVEASLGELGFDEIRLIDAEGRPIAGEATPDDPMPDE
ncbi:MAG: insulinase family protein [Gammaproteobacteria bacterium]|nr:MAG: insulinase family protein [Gammaproteobacteria bacterium]